MNIDRLIREADLVEEYYNLQDQYNNLRKVRLTSFMSYVHSEFRNFFSRYDFDFNEAAKDKTEYNDIIASYKDKIQITLSAEESDLENCMIQLYLKHKSYQKDFLYVIKVMSKRGIKTNSDRPIEDDMVEICNLISNFSSEIWEFQYESKDNGILSYNNMSLFFRNIYNEVA